MTMILSPMQQDDVTRGEFEGLKSLMNEGFEKSFEMIEIVEKNLGDKMDKVEAKVDRLDKGFDRLEAKVDSLTSEVGMLTKTVGNLAK